jgi:hypothetical protein
MPARRDLKKILIPGSGAIVIGQACEFDYSGVQAVKALKEEGYKVVLVNPNPATVMTTPGIADKIYLEPLKVPYVEEIIRLERPADDENGKINHRGDIEKVPAQYMEPVLLEQPYGQEKKRQRRERIAERNETEGGHQKNGTGDHCTAVHHVRHGGGYKSAHPVGAADLLEGSEPLRPPPDGVPYVLGGKSLPGNPPRQPQVPSHKTADADQEDRRPEHGTDSRNGNGNKKHKGKECRQQKQAVLSYKVTYLLQGDPVRREVSQNCLKLFGDRPLFDSRNRRRRVPGNGVGPVSHILLHALITPPGHTF